MGCGHHNGIKDGTNTLLAAATLTCRVAAPTGAAGAALRAPRGGSQLSRAHHHGDIICPGRPTAAGPLCAARAAPRLRLFPALPPVGMLPTRLPPVPGVCPNGQESSCMIRAGIVPLQCKEPATLEPNFFNSWPGITW